MISRNLIDNLMKNYFYDATFNLLFNNSKISYQISRRSTNNRIRNIGGSLNGFNWDCEFVNGSLHHIQILET